MRLIAIITLNCSYCYYTLIVQGLSFFFQTKQKRFSCCFLVLIYRTHTHTRKCSQINTFTRRGCSLESRSSFTVHPLFAGHRKPASAHVTRVLNPERLEFNENEQSD